MKTTNIITEFPIKHVRVREFYLVTNVRLDKALKLANGISIAPFCSVEAEKFGTTGTIGAHLRRTNIDAFAAVLSFDDRDREITGLDVNSWLPSTANRSVHLRRTRAFLALAMAVQQNPIIEFHAFELPQVTGAGVFPEEVMVYRLDERYQFFGRIVPRRQNRFIALDAAKLQDIFTRLSAMNDKAYLAFQRSITRVLTASARNDTADFALDIGIAAEAIFLHGEGGTGAKGELRYKISNRAAWFLGKTSEDRKRYAKIVRRGYDARSGAAHNGEITPKQAADARALRDCCLEALDEILLQGGFPDDWNSIVY